MTEGMAHCRGYDRNPRKGFLVTLMIEMCVFEGKSCKGVKMDVICG